jgi:hypothetical protein
MRGGERERAKREIKISKRERTGRGSVTERGNKIFLC